MFFQSVFMFLSLSSFLVTAKAGFDELFTMPSSQESPTNELKLFTTQEAVYTPQTRANFLPLTTEEEGESREKALVHHGQENRGERASTWENIIGPFAFHEEIEASDGWIPLNFYEEIEASDKWVTQGECSQSGGITTNVSADENVGSEKSAETSAQPQRKRSTSNKRSKQKEEDAPEESEDMEQKPEMKRANNSQISPITSRALPKTTPIKFVINDVQWENYTDADFLSGEAEKESNCSTSQSNIMGDSTTSSPSSWKRRVSYSLSNASPKINPKGLAYVLCMSVQDNARLEQCLTRFPNDLTAALREFNHIRVRQHLGQIHIDDLREYIEFKRR